ncbi:hypothetical protein Pcinc_009963 [Petrolisthes cinctipes]|uniref:RRM domain-containing protein n=1 Tax=Petrolisthes cinctipes TaxID=88211 RepID=A0AAE1G5P7_PETCI|nr:hypothetical protein Pcinc_009963 [Petrolisthes cinctipes]
MLLKPIPQGSRVSSNGSVILPYTQPPLALPHAPMVSHAGGVVMPSPALASPAGSPHTAAPPPHPAGPPPNPPCSTLFIANLGPSVAEHELKDIFSSLPGTTSTLLYPASHQYPPLCHYYQTPPSPKAKPRYKTKQSSKFLKVVHHSPAAVL